MTYVTAGYPTADETVNVMLGMEAGGSGMQQKQPTNLHDSDPKSDIIELGLPFTDPIADGPTIQKANTVCILMRRSICPIVNTSRSKHSSMASQSNQYWKWCGWRGKKD